jgi:hypothetical protein
MKNNSEYGQALVTTFPRLLSLETTDFPPPSHEGPGDGPQTRINAIDSEDISRKSQKYQ